MTTHRMTLRWKILVGGLGALTPIVMNLLVVDAAAISELELGIVLGYFLRVVLLFYLGGLVAYLHKEEESPIKLFELGIAAPALITALLNGAQIEAAKIPSRAATPPASTSFIPSAYAQGTTKGQVRTFSLPKENLGEQVVRGLTGSRPKNVWFVIAGSHIKLGDAQRQAQQINQKWPNFTDEVYAPYGGNPYYAVVIGANLTYEEAQKLQQRVIAAGLPKDTYVWTFPK